MLILLALPVIVAGEPDERHGDADAGLRMAPMRAMLASVFPQRPGGAP